MRKAPSRIPSLARTSLPAPAPPAASAAVASPAGLEELEEPQQQPPRTATNQRGDGSVRVAVRVRPLLPRELAINDRASLRHPSRESIELQDDKRFTFDHVFPQAATQNDLYEQSLQPWMDSFLQGFNVTVIAYGQTGSGKTYTMGNSMPSSAMVANHLLGRSTSAATSKARPEAADSLQPDDGLIPRFLFQLFERLNKASKDNHQVSVSFLEIYGEEIHDLLQSSKSNQDNSAMDSLQLRETKAGVNVIGLTEVKVGSRADAMEQMRIGSLRRITGRTEMNERSSRSHAVYTVKVVHSVNPNEKSSPKASPTAKGIVRGRQSVPRRASDSGSESGSSNPREPEPSATVVSKLTFVDLAGSERLKKTLAEGSRMKEGIQINVGLLALGNVINALGDERRRGAAHLHVPYRSSKLTRLLQDALGGNSRTLFIACVSPASSNAQETYNTLQYANRAKNIQNKAVKNIDSRSAEVLNLKAFNELLRRELIKARFVRPGATGSRAEAMVDAMLTDSTVLGYLKKLEQLAVSNLGAGSSSGGSNYITPEVQRALASLSAQFADVARIESPETPEDAGDDTDLTSRESDFDYSNSGDDTVVETFEDASTTESPVQMAPFSLYQLSRTLDIITLTLEAKETQSSEASYRQQFGAKISDIDAKLHRKELVKRGLVAALEKMDAIQAEMEAKVASSERLKSCQRESKRCADKIKAVEQDIKELECQRAARTIELEERLEKCREDLRRKHERLQKLRQRAEGPSGTTLASPLDILIRSSELKHRFNLCYLVEMADLLVGEEKDMASYLDKNEVEIAFMSSLFSKDEMMSSASYTLFQDIMEQTRDSLDKEDLNASLSKEIRRRSMLLQNIIQGWIASEDEGITEQQFLTSNEQQLRVCEENIADISAALRARRESQQSMSSLVDSVPSLDVAKSVIKRLIEEIYSQKRVYMAFFEEPESFDGNEPADSCVTSTEVEVSSELERVNALTAKFERELLDTLDMVTSFNASAGSNNELSQAQEDMLAKKYAAADEKIETLQQRELHLSAQLKEREEAEARLNKRVKELEDELKASEVKRESIRLMDRCQEIWTELGLNAEDQASKFNDINELLLKKCSEELEGLEAARETLQKRIEDAYTVVKLLETALDVESPIDLEMLHSVAGRTLLEQEKHLLRLRSRLTDELWLRVDARIAGLDRVQELLDDLKLNDLVELRHVPQDHLQNVDLCAVQRSMTQLGKWKELKSQAKTDLTVLQSLVESLVASNDEAISTECLRQDELLLSALLREKTKRVSEVEHLLGSIRSIAEEIRLSPGNIISVLRSFFAGRSSADEFDTSTEGDRIQAVAAMVVENGGGVRDISTKGIETLTGVRDAFAMISEGRSKALSFLMETVQEADKLMEEAKESARRTLETEEGSEHPETVVPVLPAVDPVSEEDFGCFYDALARGKYRLEKLTQDMEAALCTMLSSINGEFDKYGIDSATQRVTFFIGREDCGEKNPSRAILEKYVYSSTGSDSDETITASTGSTSSSECADSLLSEFDPDYDELHTIYAPSYGARQLKQLREAIDHVSVVSAAVKSAGVRLRSLHTIMTLYHSINYIKEQIAEFEEKASDKTRFSGSSLRLLEEEKFRKGMSKKYPARLAALRVEVQKWTDNESGNYDLNILGHDMKNMILDMVNTDTELMHLDLTVVDSGRSSSRRGSKTQLVSSGSSSSLCSNSSAASKSSNQSSTGARTARIRSQSAVPSRDKKLP